MTYLQLRAEFITQLEAVQREFANKIETLQATCPHTVCKWLNELYEDKLICSHCTKVMAKQPCQEYYETGMVTSISIFRNEKRCTDMKT